MWMGDSGMAVRGSEFAASDSTAATLARDVVRGPSATSYIRSSNPALPRKRSVVRASFQSPSPVPGLATRVRHAHDDMLFSNSRSDDDVFEAREHVLAHIMSRIKTQYG